MVLTIACCYAGRRRSEGTLDVWVMVLSARGWCSELGCCGGGKDEGMFIFLA